MDKAILCTHIGEFGWEILRFAPFVLWQKLNKHKNIDLKLIVQTRPDRFDLYGQHVEEFVPLEIEGDYTKYQADCFKLAGLPLQSYQKIINDLRSKYSNKYEIIGEVYPSIENKKYTEKQQYLRSKMNFNFAPRQQNYDIINTFISNDKPLITIAPRFRKHIRLRNWNHWDEFYDIIDNDNFFENYNFIICGKPPEYIPDKKDRFIDINKFPIFKNTSLIGYAIAIIQRSKLVVGSQSGIPNLANLLKTPTLQWGNERNAHEKTYNVFKTQTTFLDDKKFNIKPETIINELKKILKEKK